MYLLFATSSKITNFSGSMQRTFLMLLEQTLTFRVTGRKIELRGKEVYTLKNKFSLSLLTLLIVFTVFYQHWTASDLHILIFQYFFPCFTVETHNFRIILRGLIVCNKA